MDGRTVMPIRRSFFAHAGKAALAVLAVVGVGGCAGAIDLFGDPKAGYVGDAAGRVASADWSRAETLTVALSEYAFSPSALTFRAGAPYRLRIENGGKSTHFFVSDGFFKAIAAAKLITPSGETARPYLKSIALAPGEVKDLHFVPVRPGTYALECMAPFHAGFGMRGEIQIR